MSPVSFNHSDLPDEQSQVLRRAVRLEWITIVVVASIVVIVGTTAGSSQAMRTAFAGDMLSFLPPLAFLVAARRARKQPDETHPCGFHRFVAAGHLVASCALLGMGLWLSIDAVLGLISGDRPPIRLMTIGGLTFWSGWAMIAAILVSVSILKDGGSNLAGSVRDLLDSGATTVDGKEAHPLIDTMASLVYRELWVDDTAVRMRDMGHVFHAEVFVLPKEGHDPSMDQIEDLTGRCRNLDWKVRDTVLVPVRRLPDGLTGAGCHAVSPQ